MQEIVKLILNCSILSIIRSIFLFVGFSEDKFSFGDGNDGLGNKVYFRNSTTSIPCDVLDYYSNANKIVCETR